MTPPGKVYMVGAGPGRADLITVRGLQLLRSAQVVLYDRLIAAELLGECPPDAQLIYVGKAARSHTMPQEEINRLLVEQAQAGKQVVRLKGGDPFVFGRGGEEAQALFRAGIPFEIVPGVSSALSVPLYAGIPVTQRGVATSVAIVTGTEAPNKPKSTVDWAAVSRLSTIVLLMGVENIAAICEGLLDAGRPPDTPVAVICQGTTDNQRTVFATLATLPGMIGHEAISAPAVTVIGDVVNLATELSWFHPDGMGAGFVQFQDLSLEGE